MIITSQNWDGVTAPALSSGWSFDSGFGTSSSFSGATALSSPNVLLNASSGFYNVANYQTADPAGGQVRVTAAFTCSGDGGGADPEGSVLARLTTAIGIGGSRTSYYATIQLVQGSVSLNRQTAAGTTTLASVGGSFIGAYASPPGTWFALQLICDGTRISVNCQRLSDSQWLQTNGLWGATQVNCLSVTDSVITGSGEAGVMLYEDSTSGVEIYTDNFLFESLIDIDVLPQVSLLPRRDPAIMMPY